MKIFQKEFGQITLPNVVEWEFDYETLIEKELYQTIKSFTHVLVFGSKYGILELLMCHCNPSISIYTFEPRETCFCLLKKNLNHNNIENVMILNNALGHMRGEVTIPRDMIDVGAELASNEIIEIGDGQLVGFNNNFNFVTIDSLNLIACDMIYLEFEGFEHLAIAGAIQVIKKFKPLICYLTSTENKLNAFFGVRGSLSDLLNDLEYDCSTMHKYVIAIPRQI